MWPKGDGIRGERVCKKGGAEGRVEVREAAESFDQTSNGAAPCHGTLASLENAKADTTETERDGTVSGQSRGASGRCAAGTAEAVLVRLVFCSRARQRGAGARQKKVQPRHGVVERKKKTGHWQCQRTQRAGGWR
ncbi:hypothetical protein ERJ75_001036700 [Trypanosoma vivax]|nr:hypothetical protein ERJ75_001036700 [Trypanosoma vivax]